MHHFLEACPDTSCSHLNCAGLREIQEHERRTGFSICTTEKFRVVYEATLKAHGHIEVQKEKIEEQNVFLQEANKVSELKIQELNIKSETMSQTIGSLESRLASQEADAEQIKHDHGQALTRAHEEVETLRKENEALKRASKKAQLEAEKWQQWGHQRDKRILELETMNQALESQQLELQTDIDRVKLENANLTEEKRDISQLLVEAEEYLDKTRVSLQEVKDENEVLRQERQPVTILLIRLSHGVLELSQCSVSSMGKVLSKFQDWVNEGINRFIPNPEQVRAMFPGQSGSSEDMSARCHPSDAEHQLSVVAGTAVSSPNSFDEGKTTCASPEGQAQLNSASSLEGAEMNQAHADLALVRLPFRANSPVDLIDTDRTRSEETLSHEPPRAGRSFNHSPPRWPRGSIAERHPRKKKSKKSGAQKRREARARHGGYDSYRPGSA